MRRLRITAQVVTTLHVEFGQEARERRARVEKRVAAGRLAPLPASLIGPERLPAEAFLRGDDREIAGVLTPPMF